MGQITRIIRFSESHLLTSRGRTAIYWCPLVIKQHVYSGDYKVLRLKYLNEVFIYLH